MLTVGPVHTQDHGPGCSLLEYGDVTVTYIRRSKISHVYTLSISTGKNQSTEARGALYIPTYEYNYKVITDDTILQEYYITDRRKYENTKRCTSMNSTKGAHQFTEGKLERRTRGLEG